MIRRSLLARIALGLFSLIGTTSAIALALRRFAFKIKTKDGGIVGNVLIEAHDEDAAKVKLMKRRPGCTVLSVTEK